MINDTRRCEIIRDLNRMKLELDTCYEYMRELAKCSEVQNNKDPIYLKRNGSIRGRQNHVKSILENLRVKSVHVQPFRGVIVYLTSCGVLRQAYDHCKMAVQLLELHRIKYQVEDLNIDMDCGQNLENKLGISKDSIFENLPMIFINGQFLGNYKNLVELNDNGLLTKILKQYQTSILEICEMCNNRGYIICTQCHGSHRNMNSSLNLRCSICDINGIIRCLKCKRNENRGVG